LRRGLRRWASKNILNREPKQAEEKEEIVELKLLKGGCDVFFYNYYSSAAKACWGDAAESVKGGSAGARIAHVWDLDAG
jgi:hypothetical protein